MKGRLLISALALFLAASSLPGERPSQPALADLDADGVAEPLPPRTLAADLDGDGRLELVRYEGRSLILSAGPGKRAEPAIELPRRITGIEARDVDHDGEIDLRIDLEGGQTRLVTKAGRSLGRTASKSVVLAPIWDSGTDLNLTWDAALGRFDGDRPWDILTAALSPVRMLVYETNGDNSFQQVFATPANEAPPGAFVTLDAGDTDGDGAQELIGGETSTLNQILLYEAVGDNSYVKRPIGISEPEGPSGDSMDKVVVADADRDGKQEIIFLNSATLNTKLFIYEHSGAVGVNTYTKVFQHTFATSAIDFSVGDSDNDGRQELVFALGASSFMFPVTLVRLENTGDNSYALKSTQPGGFGGLVSTLVADLDGDGRNEIAAGGADGIFIYEATANDTYQLVFSEGGFNGTGLAIAAGRLACGVPYPAIAVGFFSGQVALWQYDGTAYAQVLTAPLQLQGNVRSVDLGHADADIRTDLVVASMGFVPVGDEGVFVFESGCP